MKKLSLFLIAVILAGYTFVSCSKGEDITTPPLTTSQQLQAKWTLESYVYHQYGTNPIQDTTEIYTGTGNDYFDFKPTSKVIFSVASYTDSFTYALVGDTSLIIEQFGNYKIQAITDHTLKLYFKTDDPAISGYFEETYNLKK
jgi:hypothetical protein